RALALQATYLVSSPSRQPVRSILMTESHSILDRVGLDRSTAESMVKDALKGADDGEMYLEHVTSESLAYDNGRLKAAAYDTSQRLGLRAVVVAQAGFAHSGDISEPPIMSAAEAVQRVTRGRHVTYCPPTR